MRLLLSYSYIILSNSVPNQIKSVADIDLAYEDTYGISCCNVLIAFMAPALQPERAQ